MLHLFPTYLVSDSNYLTVLHLLLQILDCLMFPNQIRIHSLVDLLFHALEICNEFFDWYFFRLCHFLQVSKFSLTHLSHLEKKTLFISKNTVLISWRYKRTFLWLTLLGSIPLLWTSYIPISNLYCSQISGIQHLFISCVRLLYDCMKSRYCLLKSFL